MIARDRLTEASEVLDAAAHLLPDKLRHFYEHCTEAGFTDAQALNLTRDALAALMAVPSGPELPGTAAPRGG